MKIRTLRWLLVAVGALHLFYIVEAEEKVLAVIFGMNQPTVYELPGAAGFFQLIAIPLMLAYWIVLKPFIYARMIKRDYMFFVPALSAVLILPLLLYPSRTEITADTITEHNLFGRVSEVYEVEDATLVKTGLSANAYIRKYSGAELDVDFEYALVFGDGSEYSLSPVNAEDSRWKIIEDIEETVKEKGIEKEVKGEVYYNLDFYYYSNFAGHRDLVYDILNS